MKLKTPDNTLINALRILARDVESEDGVANAMLQEAAERFAELVLENQRPTLPDNELLKQQLDYAFEPLKQKLKKRRWIPVEERLPELGIEVLIVWGEKHHPEVAWINIDDREWESMAALPIGQITHWMPLPPLLEKEAAASQ